MGTAQLIIGIVTAIGALAGLVAIPIQFGRRHRLRLAIEVRDGIAEGDREQWDEMIRRDTRAIIEGSYRSRIGLAVMLMVLGSACGVVAQSVSALNDFLRVVLLLSSFPLLGTAFAIVISDAASGRGRVGRDQTKRFIAQRRHSEEALKRAEEQLHQAEEVSRQVAEHIQSSRDTVRRSFQVATELREERPDLRELLDPLIEAYGAQLRRWDATD